MKKLFLLLLMFFLSLFFLSCGESSDDSSTSDLHCESNSDCPLGQICSAGRCIVPDSSDNGSGEGNGGGNSGSGSSSEGGSEGGNSNPSDGDVSTDDSDPEEGNVTGSCEPGKKQKCDYQGPEGTENVGPCRAAERTCKEDGTWGYCEGEVIPEYESGEDLCTNGIDDDCDGIVDNGANNACNGGYEEEDDSDVEHCETVCQINTEDGCKNKMDSEYDASLCGTNPPSPDCLCNGLDDDCDGKIDEGCPCNLGDTQACFSGKPAQRGVGTCHDGVQTCKMGPIRGTVGTWGECKGEILPKKDVCDNADNNCNGCKDEGLCCAPAIDCDYDIGNATPFIDKEIDGTLIYDIDHKFNDADTVKWEWTLTKGPCDIVLGKTSFSFASNVEGIAGVSTDTSEAITFSGIGLKKFKVNFQLSGTYNLHLKITREGDPESPYECEWPLKVVSTGLRVELCWDTNQAPKRVDVDLHVGKNGTTTAWGSSDCYFSNCRGSSSPRWYDETENGNNPRLDIDNKGEGPIPENINIDNPGDGHSFRVGAYYHPTLSTDNIETHAVVNIYCGGTRKATYGFDPLPQLTGFNKKYDFWKVVEIKWVGDNLSDECEIFPKLDNDGNYVIDRPRDTNYNNW